MANSVEFTGISSLESTTKQLAQDWTGNYKFSVGTNVSYAAVVEFGSQPHEITTDGADALHFTVNGTEVFATEVEHPGTEPQPFLRPASDATDRQAQSIVKDSDSLHDAIERLAAHVERVAKQKAPVDTGNLKMSIKYYEVT